MIYSLDDYQKMTQFQTRVRELGVELMKLEDDLRIHYLIELKTTDSIKQSRVNLKSALKDIDKIVYEE